MKKDEIEVVARWVAVSSTRGLSQASLSSSAYFSAEPHLGLFTDLGIEPVFSVVPYSLTPTPGFHEWATHAFRSDDTNFEKSQRRTPYHEVPLSKNIRATVTSVGASVFPGQISVRVTAKFMLPWLGDLASSIKPLLEVRSLKEVPFINHISLATIALAQGSKKLENFNINSTYFAFFIRLPHSLTTFQESKETLERSLTSLLIGTKVPASLSNVLVENVQRASERMNEKSSVESLLLNRLGMIYAVPSSKYEGPHSSRFSKSVNLAILATYCLEFLRDRELFKQHELLQSHFLGSKIQNWIERPEIVFDSSFSHTVTWQTLSQALHLRQRLEMWKETLEPVDASRKIEWETLSRTQWWLERDLSSALENARIVRDWGS